MHVAVAMKPPSAVGHSTICYSMHISQSCVVANVISSYQSYNTTGRTQHGKEEIQDCQKEAGKASFTKVWCGCEKGNWRQRAIIIQCCISVISGWNQKDSTQEKCNEKKDVCDDITQDALATCKE
jgi:hypothetical protein